MKGRKPAPTAIKLLRGTRPERINANEPKPDPGMPDAPEYLNDDARAEWDRMAAILLKMRVLTVADGPALGLYCMAYSRWLTACREIERNGIEVESAAGATKKSPACEVANQAEGTMFKILTDFGMTPVSRSRVEAAPDPENDSFAKFMREGIERQRASRQSRSGGDAS